MKRKQQIKKENYLERIPVHADSILWKKENTGQVTLNMENKGVFNWFAQKLLKRPKTSHIHLDSMGSFVWPLIDGKKDIYHISELVKERFGEEANPLYERLIKFFEILLSYEFIYFKNNK